MISKRPHAGVTEAWVAMGVFTSGYISCASERNIKSGSIYYIEVCNAVYERCIMKYPSVVITGSRMVLLAGLLGGLAGVVCAQIPGPGQFGSQGQGGAPAGQYPDLRNVPMTQRGTYGGFAADGRNNPIGQRDAYGGPAGGGQVPSDRRNSALDPQRGYGGGTSQYPTDPRNTPAGQRGAYGGAVSPHGSAPAYPYGGYGPIGGNTGQSQLDPRNSTMDQLRAYGSPAVDPYSSDPRNASTGTQGKQPSYRSYGGVTGVGEGKRTASGTNQAPAGPKRIYGGARTSDDLAAGTEKAPIRQPGTKGKEEATTGVPYPGGAENAAARKTDAKGRAEADQPGSDSGIADRKTDIRGGERALERSPAMRNTTGDDGAQRGGRQGTGSSAPRSGPAEESLKKRPPAGGESAEGASSISNQPGNTR